ncbi:hypothetical protein D1BOALGB6SA_7243 [Olavius sp. associated proteobacterium Delta 1]|nr:hypothetical protein D1BOALGB6SA_7243 [Olavius sp. associated proteobacterium Delta 1]
MKKTKSVFRTNVIYGVLVLVPLAVIVLLLAKIVEILEGIAEPLNLQSTTSVVGAIILAVLLVLLLCFVVGAFVRTRLGSWSLERFERTILKQIPGYEIISNALKGFTEKRTAYRAALVRLYGPGTGVLGFVMEENDNDSVTVFVPSVPTLTMGSLHVVDRERVTMLEAGSIDVTNCISQWGIGSRKILGSSPL